MTRPVPPPPRTPPDPYVYSYSEAVARLAAGADAAVAAVEALPSMACPNDQAVAFLTLHPRYLAKSYYPGEFFEATGLRPLGSRRQHVDTVRGEEHDTAQYYVAAPRALFRELPTIMRSWGSAVESQVWPPGTTRVTEKMLVSSGVLPRGPLQLLRFEAMEPVAPSERLGTLGDKSRLTLEAVLHATEEEDDAVLRSFALFVGELGGTAFVQRRIAVDGLTFLPVELPRERAAEFAQFSFLRYARDSAPLSRLQPVLFRQDAGEDNRQALLSLPTPVDRADIRIAVLDGGVDTAGPLREFVTVREDDAIGPALPEYVAHGTGVSSAALFGPLIPGEPVSMPYAKIEHVRVMDDMTHRDDPFELFTVLERVRTALTTGAPYDFVNLSIGPVGPIEDDQPHAWTTTLDALLADGRTFATVAVGNTGENDRLSGNARLLPPSDAVNALGVGAADIAGTGWDRAPYSSVGPGRRPGIVKPDVVAFGGSASTPFWVIDNEPGLMRPTAGTSFAAPALLRTAIGLRATYGAELTAVGLKALLVHVAETHPAHLDKSTSDDKARAVLEECGWGRVQLDPSELVLGPSSSVRILYQGKLGAGSTTRVSVPLPDMLQGMITIRATFCFATRVDPQDPVTYTRAALTPTFRPDSTRIQDDDEDEIVEGDSSQLDPPGENRSARYPKSRAFFRATRLRLREEQQRRLGFKWEPVLHGYETLRASSLKEPVFDVHYVARQRGGKTHATEGIPYALVLTVEAPKVVDLYDQVLARYRTLLQPLRPVTAVTVPVRAT